MTCLSEVLKFNEKFVTNNQFEAFQTSKFPNKKIVILTCMDTRLLELLPKAMGLKNGDAKIVKNAGAVISHPFGSVMRSILVAVYALQADEVCIIGHHECGMTGMKAEAILASAEQRGISAEQIRNLKYAGIDLESWLTGFECVEDSVENSVDMIRNHPLLPKDVLVSGMVIHPSTGKLDVVVNGYSQDRAETVSS
ncbi:beta-class carbonic anhydrase [Priestia megaterium]|uniref:beta-class carbonic anhydrase n=1 Tax=Priestia megaterium TaxID=1404 RepID=UPI001D586B15|nr:carbonic anhydrase [Priestia megaterium]CAH0248102.1 Beta-carbonic anhydrase 1 [Priestia megaterium]